MVLDASKRYLLFNSFGIMHSNKKIKFAWHRLVYSACCRLFAIWQGLAYKSSWIRAGVHRSRRCSSDLGLSVQPPKETAHHQLLKTFPRRTTHAMDTSSCAVAKLFGGGVMDVLAVGGQFARSGLKTSINSSLRCSEGQEILEWIIWVNPV